MLFKDLGDRNREPGQQFRLFKGVSRVRAADFGLKLAGKVAVGQARVGPLVRIEQPHGLRSGGEILRHFQKQVGGAVVLGDNLDHQVGGHGQRVLFKDDASQAIGADEGDIGPADGFTEELKIHLADHLAEFSALNESPKPSIKLVPASIVEEVRRRRHDEFPLAQLIAYAFGFVENSIVFDGEQGFGSHFGHHSSFIIFIRDYAVDSNCQRGASFDCSRPAM